MSQASVCYLAVASKSGPHVTPTSFTTFADRLWAVVGAGSIKARSLTRDPVVGVSATAAGRSVAIQGEAVVIDPTDPVSSLRALMELSLLTPALARYLLSNLGEAITWVKALMGGLMPGTAGGLPVVIAVRPIGGALLQKGAIDGFGRWLDRSMSVGAAEGEGDPAVIGWTNDAGVLALPARWDGDTARVARALAEIAQADLNGLAALTVDDAAEKRGVMLRGKGELVPEGALAELRLDTDKITYWDGTETGTVDA